jgi:hypothetical protein
MNTKNSQVISSSKTRLTINFAIYTTLKINNLYKQLPAAITPTSVIILPAHSPERVALASAPCKIEPLTRTTYNIRQQ